MIQYSYGGKETKEDKEAFAKSDGASFYIKHVRIGLDSGHLVNPWSIWFTNEYKSSKLAHRGIAALEYRKVSKSVFDLYIKYLSTQNPAYYRNAERNNI